MEAKRDQNWVPTLLGVSSSDGVTPITVYVNPVTHRMLVDTGGGGTSVTGPASSTDNAITRWDGTGGSSIQDSGVIISDANNVSGINNLVIGGSATLGSLAGLIKGTAGLLSAAVAGTDYYAPGSTDVAVADGGTGSSTAAGARTNLGLVIGTDVQAFNAILADLAGLTQAADKGIYFDTATTAATFDLSAYARTLLDDANAGAARTTLGLAIGSDVQAYNAGLAQIAGLVDPNVDRLLFWDDSAGSYAFLTLGTGLSITGTTINVSTGTAVLADGDYGDVTVSGTGTVITIDNDVVTYAKMQNVSATDKVLGRSTAGAGDVEEITFTSFARSLADDADAATARTTLGLVIGTNVQAYSANLTTFAGIAPSANVQTLLGAADYAAVRTSLGLVIGTNVQAWDADLDTLASLTATTDNFIVSVSSAWASRTPAQVRTTLGLVIGTNVQAWDADLDSWAGVTRAAGFDTFVATPSSANLRSLLTDETGTGAAVFATSPGFTTAANPVSNDGASLGTTALQWSDLFLAEGGVINWDNGDLTLTQSGNSLTLAGGEFNFGANTAYFTETDNGNSSTADTIDWKLSNKQKSTLTGNCTFTFTAPSGPCTLLLKLVQDATGSRTVTWPSTVHWSGGTAPTLTTTAAKVDIISFYWDGTTYFGTSVLNFTA